MSLNNESTPEISPCIALGESEDSFFVGFRDQVTKRFSGLELTELEPLGIGSDTVDGVFVNPRDEYKVAAVRISKKVFSRSSDLDGARGGFQHEFAVDLAEKLGGIIWDHGIESFPEGTDAKFVSYLQAKVDASQRTLENGALGDD